MARGSDQPGSGCDAQPRADGGAPRDRARARARGDSGAGPQRRAGARGRGGAGPLGTRLPAGGRAGAGTGSDRPRPAAARVPPGSGRPPSSARSGGFRRRGAGTAHGRPRAGASRPGAGRVLRFSGRSPQRPSCAADGRRPEDRSVRGPRSRGRPRLTRWRALRDRHRIDGGRPGRRRSRVNQHLKTILVWVFILVALIVVIRFFQDTGEPAQQLTQSEVYNLVEQGRIAEVTVTGDSFGFELDGKLDDGTPFSAYVVKDDQLVRTLRDKGAVVQAKKPSDGTLWLSIISWAPILLFIGVWIFFMRQMQSGGNRALSFGKSRAKLLTSQGKKVTFKDVAGCEEAKQELQEIIEFLKDPQRFQRLGGKIPKGVLLMGPPGTGKTLLARAIAGEANVPFFSISGSDFVEMFVGVGASRVRDLFEQGKKNAPCIIFIDEIDAVGRHRGAGLGGGHDEREQTLNQLLVEMDGFESNDGVILIAATNRPDVLDPALLRPGRFDRRVVVDRPDVRGREEILRVHTRRIPLGDVDLSVIARGTPGFSGADLANLVNEAALYAARQGKKKVTAEDFEIAKDKVMMGVERRSLIISEEEKRNTAFHEAGHALVAYLEPDADPLHKVTIIPRGMALGVTQQLPEDDKHTYTREYLLATLAVMMGGRAAEELFMNHITTGAGNDIERATELARRMVCEWGMSERLGPLTFGKREEQIFLGREIAKHRDYSEKTAIQIDDEVRSIVSRAYERARTLLEEHRDALIRLAENLLEREVLDSEEIKVIVEGGELPPLPPLPSPDGSPPDAEADKRPARPPRDETGGEPVLGDPLGQPS
ncbi:MAG: ATP-dependent metallopeptidase FtsH/Yme1/Tma family protein [Acidobacteria bacterium]|nr:MAG: ATP-dependent metallopeptidase FtsH/Yme1/Tma family protein [Acidobacteriota bacterium]